MNSDIRAASRRCNDMLDWLSVLATQAENHFWNTAVSEWEKTGAVSEYPETAANQMCAGATPCTRVILSDVALIMAQAIDPTALPALSDYQSLWVGMVPGIVVSMKDIVARAVTLCDPPSGGYITPVIQDAGQSMGAQMGGLLLLLGNKFPAVYTALYPTAAVTGIGAQILAGALDELVLTTVGGNLPAGAGWDGLAEGDTVIITKLDITEFAAYLNVPFLVASISGTDLILTIPEAAAPIDDGEDDPGPGPIMSASTASKPGDVFVIRKLKTEEPEA